MQRQNHKRLKTSRVEQYAQASSRKLSKEPIFFLKESYQQWKTLNILKPHLEFRGRGTFRLRTYSIPSPLTPPEQRFQLKHQEAESRGPTKKGSRQKASFPPDLKSASRLRPAPPGGPQVAASRATQGREAAGTRSLLPSCPSRVLRAGSGCGSCAGTTHVCRRKRAGRACFQPPTGAGDSGH